MPTPTTHVLAAHVFGKFAYAPGNTLSTGNVLRLFPLHPRDELATALALLIRRRHVALDHSRFVLTPAGRELLDGILSPLN